MLSQRVLCRVCGVKLGDEGEGSELFENSCVYYQHLKDLLNVKILNDEKLPTKVCSNCSCELDRFALFKKRFLKAQSCFESVFGRKTYRPIMDVSSLASAAENHCIKNEFMMNEGNSTTEQVVNVELQMTMNKAQIHNGEHNITTPNKQPSQLHIIPVRVDDLLNKSLVEEIPLKNEFIQEKSSIFDPLQIESTLKKDPLSLSPIKEVDPLQIEQEINITEGNNSQMLKMGDIVPELYFDESKSLHLIQKIKSEPVRTPNAENMNIKNPIFIQLLRNVPQRNSCEFIAGFKPDDSFRLNERTSNASENLKNGDQLSFTTEAQFETSANEPEKVDGYRYQIRKIHPAKNVNKNQLLIENSIHPFLIHNSKRVTRYIGQNANINISQLPTNARTLASAACCFNSESTAEKSTDYKRKKR